MTTQGDGLAGIGDLAFDLSEFGSLLYQLGIGLGAEFSLTVVEEAVEFIQCCSLPSLLFKLL